MEITVTLNGKRLKAEIDPGELLLDFVRRQG